MGLEVRVARAGQSLGERQAFAAAVELLRAVPADGGKGPEDAEG